MRARPGTRRSLARSKIRVASGSNATATGSPKPCCTADARLEHAQGAEIALDQVQGLAAHRLDLGDPAGEPARLEAQRLGPQAEHDGPARRAVIGQRRAVDAQPAFHNIAFQKVDRRRADEAGDEQALRPQIEVVRRADLLDLALAHADDAIGHGGRLELVVGDQDRGHAELALQALDLGAHGQAQGGVEVGERLVEQQELGPLDERAGERHALLLAARKLGRAALQQLVDLNEGGGLLGAPARLRLGHLLELEREHEVLQHAHMRIERVGLEDDPDVAVARLDLVDQGAVEQHLAAARQIDAGEHQQAGRLTAARWAEQGDELAVLDHQVHARDHHHVAEALLEVAELDACHRLSP